MRWLAVSVVVPVLLVVSATLTVRGRADSAALSLLAAVPAHAAEQNPSDFGCPRGAAGDTVTRTRLRAD